MSSLVKCSILIPVFNERKNIVDNVGALREAVRRELDAASFEILLVDNGSTDGTEHVAEEVTAKHPEVRFVRVTEKGRGAAIRAGLSAAIGEYVAILSIDRAWGESFLRAAIPLLDSGVDVVYGPKSHPDSRVSRPAYRNVASRIVRGLVFLEFGVLPGDTQCIKCFRASAISFRGDLAPYNYFAETEFFLRAAREGLTVASVPVDVNDHRRDTKVRASSFLEFWREARHFKRTVWAKSRGRA